MGFKSQDFNPHSFNVRTSQEDFVLDQNVEHYLNYAKQQRELDEMAPSKRQYRSFAIIPDIVAIDILSKYHIDIHAPETMKDPVAMRKLKTIVMTEYPHLMTSNIRK